MSAREAILRRKSYSRVTPEAPTHEQLIPLVEAVGTIADHSALHPWRLIELRGDSRVRLGEAFVAESNLYGDDAEKLAGKPLRASLLIAVVAKHVPSIKVAPWEQDAVAAGIAHQLSLLLAEEGWGVIWRTGGHTRSESVRAVHDLADNEHLLGWLYVGGVPEGAVDKSHRQSIRGDVFLTVL